MLDLHSLGLLFLITQQLFVSLKDYAAFSYSHIETFLLSILACCRAEESSQVRSTRYDQDKLLELSKIGEFHKKPLRDEEKEKEAEKRKEDKDHEEVDVDDANEELVISKKGKKRKRNTSGERIEAKAGSKRFKELSPSPFSKSAEVSSCPWFLLLQQLLSNWGASFALCVSSALACVREMALLESAKAASTTSVGGGIVLEEGDLRRLAFMTVDNTANPFMDYCWREGEETVVKKSKVLDLKSKSKFSLLSEDIPSLQQLHFSRVHSLILTLAHPVERFTSSHSVWSPHFVTSSSPTTSAPSLPKYTLPPPGPEYLVPGLALYPGTCNSVSVLNTLAACRRGDALLIGISTYFMKVLPLIRSSGVLTKIIDIDPKCACIQAFHAMCSALGPSSLVCLSGNFLVSLGELLSDVDDDVVAAAKQLKQKIEQLSGEKLDVT
jgi:hypothetical protein